MRVHLDTDFGGDIDDFAALAMLLKWPGAEITGVTTVAEEGGRRAGYVNYVLGLAARGDIPVAAGADVADGHYRFRPDYPPESEFWPEPVSPSPGPVANALALLKNSIDQGAVIVGIGPCTNLALLDQCYPNVLERAQVYLVGGYIYPPRRSRSLLDNETDYNFQLDVSSAHHVLTHCLPTIIPMHVTVETSLRHAHLPALQDAGPVGALMAWQALAFALTGEFEAAGAMMESYLDRCSGLPADLINHLYDPLGCAVALGWSGPVVEHLPLRLSIENGWLHERIENGARLFPVVTRVDGPAFDDLWLGIVTS